MSPLRFHTKTCLKTTHGAIEESSEEACSSCTVRPTMRRAPPLRPLCRRGYALSTPPRPSSSTAPFPELVVADRPTIVSPSRESLRLYASTHLDMVRVLTQRVRYRDVLKLSRAFNNTFNQRGQNMYVRLIHHLSSSCLALYSRRLSILYSRDNVSLS